MEAVEKDNMVQVARKYNINHGQLSKWKKYFLENGHHVFEATPDKEKAQLEKKVGKLEQIIGRKEVELALLKNFADFYASHDTS